MSKAVKVSIVYCANCGYEGQALALTGDMLREFRFNLSSLELIPWHDGTFDVVVDGRLVHSMLREGGFPTSATVAAAIRGRLAEEPDANPA